MEDQGGKPTLENIRVLFGQCVADIVEACSDADTLPKPPWRERKERYIAHLQHADGSVLRVALADKLHNARAIVLDYRTLSEDLWTRFNANRDDILWYYRAVLAVLAMRLTSPFVGELKRTIEELEALIAGETSAGVSSHPGSGAWLMRSIVDDGLPVRRQLWHGERFPDSGQGGGGLHRVGVLLPPGLLCAGGQEGNSFRFFPPTNIELSMRNRATETIERWLATELNGAAAQETSAALASLAGVPASERVVALYGVLSTNPALAWKTANLRLLDQLRLSLDLVRAASPQPVPHAQIVAAPTTAAGCRAYRRGRPQRRWFR